MYHMLNRMHLIRSLQYNTLYYIMYLYCPTVYDVCSTAQRVYYKLHNTYQQIQHIISHTQQQLINLHSYVAQYKYISITQYIIQLELQIITVPIRLPYKAAKYITLHSIRYITHTQTINEMSRAIQCIGTAYFIEYNDVLIQTLIIINDFIDTLYRSMKHTKLYILPYDTLLIIIITLSHILPYKSNKHINIAHWFINSIDALI